MTWAQDRRLDWLDDQFARGLTVRRDGLVSYFGISTPQASGDIQRYLNGGDSPHIGYDRSRKHYFAQPDFASVRGSSAERIAAWDTFNPVDKPNGLPE